jgi:hypothetical protein
MCATSTAKALLRRLFRHLHRRPDLGPRLAGLSGIPYGLAEEVIGRSLDAPELAEHACGPLGCELPELFEQGS